MENVNNVKNEKIITRKTIKEKLSKLSKSKIEQFSKDICQKIESLDSFEKANNVALFSALPNEPNLNPIIDKLLNKNVNVFLPRIFGDEIELVKISKDTRFSVNQWKISEPLGETFDDLSQIDLIFIPLVAFDNSNHRLGHGKGFYDRLLTKMPTAEKIGIAFSCQKVSCAPTESHDVPLSKIITEKSINLI